MLKVFGMGCVGVRKKVAFVHNGGVCGSILQHWTRGGRGSDICRIIRPRLLYFANTGIKQKTVFRAQRPRKDQWTDGWIGVLVDGLADGRMDGRTDGRTDGWTDGRADGRTDGRAGGRTDGRTGGRAGGRTDGRAGGRTGGRAVGRAVGIVTRYPPWDYKTK